MSDVHTTAGSPPPHASALPKLAIWGVALVAAAIGMRALIRGSHEGQGERHSAVGQRLSPLRLERLELPGVAASAPVPEGESPPLDDRVSLLNFWGVWCGPCRQEFPKLLEARRRLSAESPRFQLVSISCRGDDVRPGDVASLAESTAEFLRELPSPPRQLQVFFDPDRESRRALLDLLQQAQFTYPTSVLVDGQRVVRGVWQGYYPGMEEDIERAARALLQARRQ